jgi:hypothetical protein
VLRVAWLAPDFGDDWPVGSIGFCTGFLRWWFDDGGVDGGGPNGATGVRSVATMKKDKCRNSGLGNYGVPSLSH